MRKSHVLIVSIVFSIVSFYLVAEDEVFKLSKNIPNKNISYKKFLDNAIKIEPYRKKRRINVEQFIQYSKEKNTIILDTRSRKNYLKIHIKGAKHLSFTEFDVKSLLKIIPNKNTRILIYCNNNFDTTNPALYSKLKGASLNIPTFIHLNTYGYKNVYELGPVVNLEKTKLTFEKDLK